MMLAISTTIELDQAGGFRHQNLLEPGGSQRIFINARLSLARHIGSVRQISYYVLSLLPLGG
jgi:hypothetical protein